MRFSTIIQSGEILSEIIEGVAFELIQNQEKLEFIINTSEEKENSGFFDKIGDFFDKWVNKAKNAILKPKKQEKVLKDINTAAKALANIDATFICLNAPLSYNDENDNLDFDDIYNVKPIADLFISTAKKIGMKEYEKALEFQPFNEPNAEKMIVHEKVGDKFIEEPENKIELNNCLETIEERKDDFHNKFKYELDDDLEKEFEELNMKQENHLKRLLIMSDSNKVHNYNVKEQRERIKKLKKKLQYALNYSRNLTLENNLIRNKFEYFHSNFELHFKTFIVTDRKKRPPVTLNFESLSIALGKAKKLPSLKKGGLKSLHKDNDDD